MKFPAPTRGRGGARQSRRYPYGLEIVENSTILTQVSDFALFDGLRRHGGVESRGPALTICDLPEAHYSRVGALPNPWMYSRALQGVIQSVDVHVGSCSLTTTYHRVESKVLNSNTEQEYRRPTWLILKNGDY